MPSPFPGMNPYLEAPEIWPGVHMELISSIRAAINGTVPQNYFADAEERVYVCELDDPARHLIVPDLSIRETANWRPDADQSSGSGTAVAPLQACIVDDVEQTERRIVLRMLDNHEVVTVIEVLSPANKRPGSNGRKTYERKRREVMNSSSHFIEIDLLRAGEHTKLQAAVAPCDYQIGLSRVENRPKADWWQLRLQDRLPRIPIPLHGDDADVEIDLQNILDEVYDRAGYRRRLDYRHAAPGPELTAEQSEWLHQFCQ